MGQWIAGVVWTTGFALAWPGIGEAAEHRRPTYDVALGVTAGVSELRDDTLYPVVHRGPSVGLGVAIVRRQGAHRTELTFRPSYSRLSHRYQWNSDDFMAQSDIGLRHLVKVGDPATARLELGGGLGISHLLAYLPYWEETHVYWATSAHLDAAAAWVWPGRAHRTQIAAPLLALVSRPPASRLTVADDISARGFLTAMHSNIRGGTVDRHLGVVLTHEWRLPWLQDRLALEVRLDYARVRHRGDGALQRLDTQLFTKVVW